MPLLSTTEVGDWAAVASAAFAAAAAIASWWGIRRNRRTWMATRRPELHISVIEGIDTPRVKIHVENHGDGFARQVMFCVVEGNATAYGALPPTGVLAGGEARTLMT